MKDGGGRERLSGQRQVAISHLDWNPILIGYAAPLALFAASLVNSSQCRRSVAKTALLGFALPLFGSVLLIGVTNVATFYSGLYQPSLEPNIPMALWSNTAASAVPGRMLIVGITVFGALRFGVRALITTASIRVPGGGTRSWAKLAGLFVAVTWLSLHEQADVLSMVLDVSATALVGTIAVLTVDYLTGGGWAGKARRVDWIGSAAVLASVASMPAWTAVTGAPLWSREWLLPSYGAGLLVCIAGRMIQKLALHGLLRMQEDRQIRT